VQGYKLVWSEEFNGNSLNRSKWKYRSLGKRGDAFNVPQAVWLDGKGHLVIEARAKNDSIIAGMIDTEGLFETRYGYFECRAFLTKTPGIWPAFWLQSSINGHNGIPSVNGAEIDIFEYFIHAKADSVSHTLHYGGYGATHKVAGPVWGGLKKTADGFHTFGLEWTANSYTTFVDGIKTYSGNTLVSKVPEFLVLSLEVNREVAGPLDPRQLPDKFIVDYVRVYAKN
jgi:beta-glucanase (GH16 family)